MSVPMMKVWEMRVVVDERRVPVRVRVWFARGLRAVMFVPVVIVVHVRMIVLHLVMLVQVIVTLSNE